ncbi:pentapeptide repeat-containing protein [Aliarcobacter butzleri]|uniref:pentapeptide repeat-containing protein n=1 Tax=Aliarcobacter butzleri TaxID=28197 RepID=UPI0021B3904E|nr:pentapeptide repeat-containing protein [Aliarcobacter butzleri]MCT7601793.1 pentapeptide repeat-containing protein [Aliarcobacter butzleri]MCT7605964.1 pentapeptide repeat-containing protein [Aliarcobacter butzleri]MCT7608312.1 pentapeptide repeat-containing protein [Aliarcobacter butzleri]
MPNKLIEIIFENIDKKDLEYVILNRIKNELNKINYHKLKRVQVIEKGEFHYFTFEVVKEILISNKYQINEKVNELGDLERSILQNNEEFGEYIFKIVNKSKESLNVLNDFFKGTFFDDSEERIFKKILNKKIVIKEFVFDDCQDYAYILSKIEKVEFEKCTFNNDFNFIENKTYHFKSCNFENELTISNCQTFENESLFFDCEFKKVVNIKSVTINIELFKNCRIEILNAYNCTFNKKIINDIWEKCKGIKLNSLRFHNCIIKEDFYLANSSNSYYENLIFLNCTFEREFDLYLDFNLKINKIQLFSCNFESEFKINVAKIKWLEIQNTIFSGNVDLGSNIIEIFDLKSSNFTKNCNFYNTSFVKYNDFRFTTFNQSVNFSKAKFNNIDFGDTNFLSFVDFSEIKNIENEQIECEKIENRKTARILKSKLDESNNIIESNYFYSIEMKKREKELEEDIREGKNFFEWLVFKIHGLSSNHSQDWLLALFWIISFTLLSVTIEKIFSSHIGLSDKCVVSFLIFSMIVISNIYLANSKKVYYLIFIAIYFFIYLIFTEDLYLKCFSKTLNPFSLMQANDPINGIELLYKIIIAYLIYQLIISIRQNTRRK